MTVRVKIGGLGGGYWWPVPTGGMRVKDGAGWRRPNKCYVKIGAVGQAGGYWYDSGYVGYPNPPTGFSVTSWNFNVTNVTWTAPVSGAPVSSYEVIKLDSAHVLVPGYPIDVGNVTSYNGFSTVPDEKCDFYVRSKAASGLTSSMVGMAAQIGHTYTGSNVTTNHTAPWNSERTIVNLYLDNYLHTIFVPADVHQELWYLNLANYEASPAWTKLSPAPGDAAPPNGRRLFHVLHGLPQWGPPDGAPGTSWHNRLDVPNPFIPTGHPNGPGWAATDFWGEGKTWGWAIDGLGFQRGSTGPNRIHGDFQIFGTRYWSTTEFVVSSPAVNNSYTAL